MWSPRLTWPEAFTVPSIAGVSRIKWSHGVAYQAEPDKVPGLLAVCACENFLYGFKAAPRGRSRRRLGGLAVAPAPAGQRRRSAGAKILMGAA